MPRILSRYLVRQVALPTLLSLLTITFVLLIGIIYDLMDLLLRPGVRFGQVLYVLVTTIPSFMVFAAPMAMLIGTLIGIGRLTMDREVLAMRAAGINVLRVFAPMLVGAFLISGGILWINGNIVPRLMLESLGGITDLQFQLMSGLEPGRFHDKLAGGGDQDLILYFRERDEKTGQMRGVTLKMDEGIREEDQARYEAAQNRLKQSVGHAADKLKGIGNAMDAGTQQAATTESTSTVPVAKAKRKKISDDGLYLRTRNSEVTWVFAESGEIRADLRDDKGGTRKAAEIVLALNNGSIHRLMPDPEQRDYVTIPFQRLEKKLVASAAIRKANKTKTNAELLDDLRGRTKGGGRERAELLERHAMALAFFVFTLLGVPLAIWIKPTGKSWGILLAVALMLIYYVVMKLGLSAVQADRMGGVVVAFLPNILFTVLGAGLWWHNLRT